MKTYKLRRSEVLVSNGLLGEAANQAASQGLRFVSVHGKYFELEPSRQAGSSLGLSQVQVQVVD